MTRDVRTLDEMKALVAAGGDISDVVYHYKCPVCGKRKKITMGFGDAKLAYIGGKSRLEVVLENDNKCVTCARMDGTVKPLYRNDDLDLGGNGGDEDGDGGDDGED